MTKMRKNKPPVEIVRTMVIQLLLTCERAYYTMIQIQMQLRIHMHLIQRHLIRTTCPDSIPLALLDNCTTSPSAKRKAVLDLMPSTTEIYVNPFWDLSVLAFISSPTTICCTARFHWCIQFWIVSGKGGSIFQLIMTLHDWDIISLILFLKSDSKMLNWIPIHDSHLPKHIQ